MANDRQSIRQAIARRMLLRFTQETFPTYQANWFASELSQALDGFLDDVTARRSPRLILEAPPRHGKSEIVSRRFPAYAFGRNPDLEIIAASHTADLARKINRDLQRIIDTPEYRSIYPTVRLNGKETREDAHGVYLRNTDEFEIVGHRGSYRAAGVGGSITGRGADIILVDDPLKDAEQAWSATYREKVWEWFTTTASTRLSPGGGMAIIMTRWHQDDLAGRLQRLAKEGKGEQYRVLSFRAIADTDEPHRKAGEALHPERWPLEALLSKKVALGSKVFGPLYQQQPAMAEGEIYKRSWFNYFRRTSSDVGELIAALGITKVVTFWDTAFKVGEENDYTAGVTIGLSANRYYVLDVWSGRVEFPELKRAVIAQYHKWNPQSVLVEDKASGQSLIQEMKRETNLPIIAVKCDRDKVARANAVTPLVEAGTVLLPTNAAWVSDFLNELCSFPAAPHDDQVDAFNGALAYLSQRHRILLA